MPTYIHEPTTRDRQMLQHIADGLSIGQAADAMGVGRPRISRAIADLKAITGHASRDDAIRAAREAGWVT